MQVRYQAAPHTVFSYCSVLKVHAFWKINMRGLKSVIVHSFTSIKAAVDTLLKLAAKCCLSVLVNDKKS